MPTKDIKLTITIPYRDFRDALADINDERRQSELPKLTVQKALAALKDPETLEDLATTHLESVMEYIGG